jgi:hypothetical protein
MVQSQPVSIIIKSRELSLQETFNFLSPNMPCLGKVFGKMTASLSVADKSSILFRMMQVI